MKRSKRKIYIKTPSGKIRIHIKKKKASFQKCALCKKPLKIIPKLEISKFRSLSYSKKSSSRMFGNMCSSCSRRLIINRFRSMELKS